MKLTYVTALVLPRNKHCHRNVREYVRWFQYLVDTGVPILLYLDPELTDVVAAFPNITVVSAAVTWHDNVVLPEWRNVKKDTADYMAIQLSKLRFMADAADRCKTDYLAWIDFGVFHMFKDIAAAQAKLRAFTEREWPVGRILAPGCWAQGNYDVWDRICWRFCGGFLLGHRGLFPLAYVRQAQLVKKGLPRLTWEVNYWTQMEEYFRVYPGDHNDLLLALPV